MFFFTIFPSKGCCNQHSFGKMAPIWPAIATELFAFLLQEKKNEKHLMADYSFSFIHLFTKIYFVQVKALFSDTKKLSSSFYGF